RLDSTVSRINALASQIAELNVQVVASESDGKTANDLRDMRDLKLDELSKIAGTRVINQPDGSVSVLIGNSTLVGGDSAVPLSIQMETPNPLPTTPLTDVPVRLRLGDSPDRLAPIGGQLSALVDVLNTEIPAYRGRLDAMASQLVQAVNTKHTGGFVFNGNTVPGAAAGNFFAPGSTTNPVRAATIGLHSTVAADPSAIAASGNANAPTDNSVSQGLAGLRSATNTVTWTAPNGATETGSFLEFFRGLVTRLGIQTSTATDNASVADNLVEQADKRRQSVSGVSTDEELVNMLRVQQSYQAATKLITAADEMLQSLLSLI
ncbi:MAG: flagellar hook-associated protein FlgK, partial [Gemmatimonas sp.]